MTYYLNFISRSRPCQINDEDLCMLPTLNINLDDQFIDGFSRTTETRYADWNIINIIVTVSTLSHAQDVPNLMTKTYDILQTLKINLNDQSTSKRTLLSHVPIVRKHENRTDRLPL
ncbi:hypothetical protein CEXT_407401 [Caerostris extrusa]|uniref:Uncharacterized protein n=1 Tax=Caerostris extrusa TaxID=172846 RepID=A0AAV4QWZ1_CAEEX|nr:hypothetical protein CEXT_407401 [Caerostris extrusa]